MHKSLINQLVIWGKYLHQSEIANTSVSTTSIRNYFHSGNLTRLIRRKNLKFVLQKTRPVSLVMSRPNHPCWNQSLQHYWSKSVWIWYNVWNFIGPPKPFPFSVMVSAFDSRSFSPGLSLNSGTDRCVLLIRTPNKIKPVTRCRLLLV